MPVSARHCSGYPMYAQRYRVVAVTSLLGYLRQRAFAAPFAIRLRAASERDLALAVPPRRPPARPLATAAGSLPAFGSVSCASPVDRSTISFAS